MYEMVTNFLESTLILIGAYGFWCFVNYSVEENANKEIKKDV